MTLPRLLRAATLALLFLFLVVGIPSESEEGRPVAPLLVSVSELEGWGGDADGGASGFGVDRERSGLASDRDGSGVAADPGPSALAVDRDRSGSAAGGDSTWLRLLRHGAEAPIHAILPGDPPGAAPPVTPILPQRLRADRPAGLGVEAHRGVELALTTSAGVSRELSLGEGDEGAFLLRPREPGPAQWELAVPGGPTESLSGWVEPSRPLRILALSGPPSPESRMALQALEESGEEVEAWIHLGRELWVGRDPGPLPRDPEAYGAVDVVILFPGLPLPEPVIEILRRRVEEEGLGFLLAGGPAPSAEAVPSAETAPHPADLLRGPSLAAGIGATTSAAAESLRWTLPVEISPLPPADLEIHLHGEGADASPLTLATAGRGRIGILSIADSWRWRMESDEAEGHRAFWKSAASWLAGGVVHDPILEVAGDRVRVGEEVRIRILGRSEGRAPTHLVVTPPAGGPDGAPDAARHAAWTLALPSSTALGPVQLQEIRFVPFEPGPYLLEARWEEGETPELRSSLLVLDREASELDVAGRLARLAVASPGGGVRGEDARAPGPASPPLPWALLLFGMLALLLTAEWLVRRLAGRP